MPEKFKLQSEPQVTQASIAFPKPAPAASKPEAPSAP